MWSRISSTQLVEAHALVFGEIVQQCGQSFLQAQRNVDTLDLQRRSRVQQAVTEPEMVPVQVAHAVVA